MGMLGIHLAYIIIKGNVLGGNSSDSKYTCQYIYFSDRGVSKTRASRIRCRLSVPLKGPGNAFTRLFIESVKHFGLKDEGGADESQLSALLENIGLITFDSGNLPAPSLHPTRTRHNL